MSQANPTPVRVGMTGTFAGKPYTIIARVVMGMEEEGETYYWNEFYLSDGSDRIAMLVCEEVYGAHQWRLFTEFTPANPLTAAQAAALKVGCHANLDGASAEVTVVDETRVYEIEGKAPDWVAVGDVAQYFNAEAGGKMWVVSWSGDEVEYYRGMQLHPEAVAQALRLPPAAFKPAARISSLTGSGGGRNIGGTLALIACAVGGFLYLRSGITGPHRPPAHPASLPPQAVQPQPAPPSPLTVGTNVVLDGRVFRVVSHRIVEFSKVNARWSSRQYEVTDDAGQTSLLVLRAQPNSSNWQLFKPLAPARPPTPLVAAAMRTGETVTLDDFQGRVSALFMSRTVTNSGASPGALSGGLTYHYLAQTNTSTLLASWNGERIVFHRGQPVAKHTP